MTAYNKEQPKTIQSMFGSIAKSYDRTNGILSFQLHRIWNRALLKKTIGKRQEGVLADLCCGTGEIAFSFLKNKKMRKKVYLIDFCPEMLECAKIRAQNQKFDLTHDLSYIEADVQALPIASASADFATIAYGIRNVQSPLKCFKEAYRILKPGGSFGILELTEPSNACIRPLHKFYLKYILPKLGKMTASNQEAYQYLSQSIQAFAKPSELALLLAEVGFQKIQITPITAGVATVIVAQKC